MTPLPAQLEIGIATHNSDLYRQAVALRYEVLRRPIGLDFSDAQLAAESDELHLVGLQNDAVVVCLSLQYSGADKFKMRQVAVLPALQGQGLGSALCRYAEKLALAQGKTQIYCHARQTAVAFYTRLGYECVGESFEEVGLPHYLMRKYLAD